MEYGNKEPSEHLNHHFVNVGGEFDEFHMPNIDQQYHQSFSVSIGQVKAELLRIKVKKSVNTDDFPSWITGEFAEIPMWAINRHNQYHVLPT